MNDIEEAIIYFQETNRKLKQVGEYDFHNDIKQHDIAIAALQEKAERMKGCEYCNYDKEVYLMANQKYCSHCGCKLGED